MSSDNENLAKLKELYYDPETGFGNASDMYKQVKALGLTKGRNKLTLKTIKEFIQRQETVQVTKQFKKPKKFTTIRAKRAGTNYQTDLLEFSTSKNGYNFLLNVVDIHSRYAFSVPIRRKSKEAVVEAFKTHILTKAKRDKNGKLLLKQLHSDEGKEYLNRGFAKLMRDNGIEHTYSREGEYAKNSIVERFNRTLREMMRKRRGTFKVGEDSFQAIIRNYNRKDHRTIKAAPLDVWQGIKKNKQHYRDMLYGFNVGDRVRVVYKKKLFEKGTYGYSKDVYTISKIDKQKHYVVDDDRESFKDSKGRNRYYMGYEMQLVKGVEREEKSSKERKKEEEQESKARGKKTLKRRLNKEGIDPGLIENKKTRGNARQTRGNVKQTRGKEKQVKEWIKWAKEGKRIKIKWDDKGEMTLNAEKTRGKYYDKYYPGTIERYNKEKNRFYIRYDDDKNKLYRINLTDRGSPSRREGNYIPKANWKML